MKPARHAHRFRDAASRTRPRTAALSAILPAAQRTQWHTMSAQPAKYASAAARRYGYGNVSRRKPVRWLRPRTYEEVYANTMHNKKNSQQHTNTVTQISRQRHGQLTGITRNSQHARPKNTVRSPRTRYQHQASQPGRYLTHARS
jgi:hypothetical protein